MQDERLDRLERQVRRLKRRVKLLVRRRTVRRRVARLDRPRLPLKMVIRHEGLPASEPVVDAEFGLEQPCAFTGCDRSTGDALAEFCDGCRVRQVRDAAMLQRLDALEAALRRLHGTQGCVNCKGTGECLYEDGRTMTCKQVACRPARV